jgi:hypothetical protein
MVIQRDLKWGKYSKKVSMFVHDPPMVQKNAESGHSTNLE